MTPKIHTIALWSGIAGAAAAVYFPIRSEIDSAHKVEVQEAAQRQKLIDSLYQRIGNDEADIAFIKAQLPKDKQAILEAIWKMREQARAQDAALVEKSKLKPIRVLTGEKWRGVIIARVPMYEEVASVDSSTRYSTSTAARKSPPTQKTE
jgi:hypothetical protein